MSIYFDEVEPMHVRENDPSKHTVSVGYKGKDNIVVTIMDEDNKPIATAILDYKTANVVNSLLGVAIETMALDKGIVKELVE